MLMDDTLSFWDCNTNWEKSEQGTDLRAAAAWQAVVTWLVTECNVSTDISDRSDGQYASKVWHKILKYSQNNYWKYFWVHLFDIFHLNAMVIKHKETYTFVLIVKP